MKGVARSDSGFPPESEGERESQYARTSLASNSRMADIHEKVQDATQAYGRICARQ